MVFLGLKTTKRIKMDILSSKILGFLQIIPIDMFRILQKNHYSSLYSFQISDSAIKSPKQKTLYFILFGPLSLCNASASVTANFCHFDHVMGDPLIWTVKYETRSEKTTTSAERNHCSVSSSDTFSVTDMAFSPTKNAYVPCQISAIKDLWETITYSGRIGRANYFVKVILSDLSDKRFHSYEYIPDTEIFVNYSLSDVLI